MWNKLVLTLGCVAMELNIRKKKNLIILMLFNTYGIYVYMMPLNMSENML